MQSEFDTPSLKVKHSSTCQTTQTMFKCTFTSCGDFKKKGTKVIYVLESRIFLHVLLSLTPCLIVSVVKLKYNEAW